MLHRNIVCAIVCALQRLRAHSNKGATMSSLSSTLANLMRQKRKWYATLPSAANAKVYGENGRGASHLIETIDFGSNPGRLRMFSYCPPGLPAGAPLVVALHGCTQNAAGYDRGSGWSELADEYGFAVLLPEQQRSNNPNLCFDWFLRGDIERDQGEALSIREMVAHMLAAHDLDDRRVFVTGLSAGGAMTAVMLSTYPELFVAGAIIGGVPYGAARNVREAFAGMAGTVRTAEQWGDEVRGASGHDGPWPSVSIWHGTADPTVRPVNAEELAKQWTEVHGLGAMEPRRDDLAGHERLTWSGPSGVSVEMITIAGMAHGVPVDPTEEAGGEVGPYFLDAGIASSRHIAAFWGLIPEEALSRPRTAPAAPRLTGVTLPAMTGPLVAGAVLAEVAPTEAPSLEPVDVNEVITKALRTAGLLR
jgi:poly(hydroxyalkanoate) depolymerase family esterase